MKLDDDNATVYKPSMSSRAFPFIGNPVRLPKPRSRGLSMVLDKGLGFRGAEDLVETGAEYIDIIKLGWGTSCLYTETALVRKLALYREAGIRTCTGGTLAEIAYDHTEFDEFLKESKRLGFTSVEVSNGIHPALTAEKKRELIRVAVGEGMHVFSEVGRKLVEEDRAISAKARIEEAKADLEAGASKVIFEARESGTVGVFRSDGSVNSEMACELFQSLDVDDIIWEAPRKDQQVWLVRQLGPHVNIGNIATSDVIPVETLRQGLRGDTMRDFRPGTRVAYLELGVGGALRARERGDLVVMIDALRASTTILQALDCGADSVIPVVSINDVSGDITAGERGGVQLPNADLSNSPHDMLGAALAGKHLVLSTTNGTECIRAAFSDTTRVFIGSVTNATAVAEYLHQEMERSGRNATLLVAGRNNQVANEDLIAATEILRRLSPITARGLLEPLYSKDVARDFMTSDSGMNLARLGASRDVLLCAEVDRFDFVAEFDGERVRKVVDGAPQAQR